MPTIQHKGLNRPVSLGRIRPLAGYDLGGYRIVVSPDGANHRVPRFAAHYQKSLDVSPPPANVDWSAKAIPALSQIYDNDRLGDCVIAAQGHGVGVWSGNETGTPIIATDAEIQHDYVSICGPGDNGCVIASVLHAMKKKRFVMAGAKARLAGYVAIDWTNQNEVMTAIEVFGAMTIGVNLTNDCEDSGPGVIWNFSGQFVGGHAVLAYGYTPQGLLIATWGTIGTVIPWGVATVDASPPCHPTWSSDSRTIGTVIPWGVATVDAGNNGGIEEAYVCLSPNWDSYDNMAPNGINSATLAEDLAGIS